jgi:hypothetical protein
MILFYIFGVESQEATAGIMAKKETGIMEYWGNWKMGKTKMQKRLTQYFKIPIFQAPSCLSVHPIFQYSIIPTFRSFE